MRWGETPAIRSEQRLAHFSQGLAPVADAQLLLGSQLCQGAAQLGNLEDGVVAESVVPPGLSSDHAPQGPSENLQHHSSPSQRDPALESGRPPRIRHLAQFLQDFPAAFFIAGLRTEVAGGIDPRPAGQGIHQQPESSAMVGSWLNRL